MVVLTEKLVAVRTRQDRLEQIRHLNLWGQELTDVSILAKMPGLEVLALPVNNLTSLRELRKCTNLRELYLRKNKVAEVEDVRYLQSMKDLQVLSLEENPCVTVPNYRLKVLQYLPHLKKLDSIAVTEKELRNAQLMLQIGDADGAGVPSQSSKPGSRQIKSSLSQGAAPRSPGLIGESDVYGRSSPLLTDQQAKPCELAGQGRNGVMWTPRSNSTQGRIVADTPGPYVQPPRTPPRALYDPEQMNSPRVQNFDQQGVPNGAPSSPGVLYAVLTLLGELDANALKVIKADVEQRLASVIP